MGGDEEFLSRWSKRKAESRNETPAEAPEETLEVAAIDAEGATEAAEDADDPDDHPAAGIDIDSLDYNSDFTVFMHEKVPEVLRRRALRQLWQSNPIFGALDGLNDYDEDFTDSALVVEGLKQAYDAARAKLKEQEEKEREEKAEAEKVADAEAGDEEDQEAATAEDGDEPEDAPETAPEHADKRRVADASDHEIDDGDAELDM